MPFVVVTTGGVRGIRLYGPFDSEEDVVAFIDARPTLVGADIVPICSPTSLDRSIQAAQSAVR